MTSVGVSTYVSTRVHTAVHLSDVITGTLTHILAHLGLDPSYLTRHWATIEEGLKVWIAEGSLIDVRLEVGDAVDPEAVFEIPLDYRVSGDGNVEFVTSQARQTRALAKLASVPSGSTYRVVVSHEDGYTRVDGWRDTTAADTSGLSSYSMGGLGSGPDASASLTYHSRG